jgi:hypothetical protein
MRNLLLALMCFAFIGASGQGSVTIAATNGGAIELTPEGIVKHEPNMMLLRGINSEKKEIAPAIPDVVKEMKLKLNILDIEEARQIRNTLAYVIYQDNPDSVDYKALIRTIKYIDDYKNLSERDKGFGIIITEKSAERIMGNTMFEVDMYKDQLERAKITEKLAKQMFKEVRKEEAVLEIKEEKRISKRFENQFKDVDLEEPEPEKEPILKGIFKKKKDK